MSVPTIDEPEQISWRGHTLTWVTEMPAPNFNNSKEAGRAIYCVASPHGTSWRATLSCSTSDARLFSPTGHGATPHGALDDARDQTLAFVRERLSSCVVPRGAIPRNESLQRASRALRGYLDEVHAAVAKDGSFSDANLGSYIREVIDQREKLRGYSTDYQERWLNVCDLFSVSAGADAGTLLADVKELLLERDRLRERVRELEKT